MQVSHHYAFMFFFGQAIRLTKDKHKYLWYCNLDVSLLADKYHFLFYRLGDASLTIHNFLRKHSRERTHDFQVYLQQQ